MAQQQTPAELPPFGEIRAAVDSVVTTHGAYIPVELLLTMGQLRYTDYEAWRRGGQSSLQSVLACEARQTVDLLKEAARWARALGLEPDVQAYFGWGGLARQRLVFFNDGPHEADRLLATHYVRPGELAAGDQLDLFLDSGATVALQDMRAALRARDTEAAEQHLATLDPAPETALFPSRLLLAEPGLARALPSGLAAGDSTAEEAFRAVRQLLIEDCIETRAAVRDAAPWLLADYLALRASS